MTEECTEIAYCHSFPSAVIFIPILCKHYGYCEFVLQTDTQFCSVP